jgi:hypothetical protein
MSLLAIWEKKSEIYIYELCSTCLIICLPYHYFIHKNSRTFLSDSSLLSDRSTFMSLSNSFKYSSHLFMDVLQCRIFLCSPFSESLFKPSSRRIFIMPFSNRRRFPFSHLSLDFPFPLGRRWIVKEKCRRWLPFYLFLSLRQC